MVDHIWEIPRQAFFGFKCFNFNTWGIIVDYLGNYLASVSTKDGYYKDIKTLLLNLAVHTSNMQ